MFAGLTPLFVFFSTITSALSRIVRTASFSASNATGASVYRVI